MVGFVSNILSQDYRVTLLRLSLLFIDHALSSRSPASFEWESKNYTWQTNSTRQIAVCTSINVGVPSADCAYAFPQLYEESDPDRPIAWFQTSKRGVQDDGQQVIYRAVLALQREGLAILDAVVTSLLVVEQGLRWRDARYKNADGRATFMVYF